MQLQKNGYKAGGGAILRAGMEPSAPKVPTGPNLGLLSKLGANRHNILYNTNQPKTSFMPL